MRSWSEACCWSSALIWSRLRRRSPAHVPCRSCRWARRHAHVLKNPGTHSPGRAHNRACDGACVVLGTMLERAALGAHATLGVCAILARVWSWLNPWRTWGSMVLSHALLSIVEHLAGAGVYATHPVERISNGRHTDSWRARAQACAWLLWHASLPFGPSL